jgi:hypothetical protein
MPVLSFFLDILDVLDVLLCLFYHICPALRDLAYFLSLPMLSTLSFTPGYKYNFTYDRIFQWVQPPFSLKYVHCSHWCN